MASKKNFDRNPRASENINATPAKTGEAAELTESDMDAVSGGTGHCATGKHFAEVKITARK
jgi:hypothetical protein